MSRPIPAELSGGRFRIVRKLGAGGMGVVYQAHDRERDTDVALKTLRRLSAQGLVRFKREFRLLAGLTHPNLVALGELMEEDGGWFFTMELVHGVPFCQRVRARVTTPADLDETLTSALTGARMVTQHGSGAGAGASPSCDEVRLRPALCELARGLHALHSAGRVHRDIKPSNVLCTEAGRVVILDFGLAADINETRRDSEEIIGTPAYMAPENALGEYSAASDWYSFGVMLYEALTGQLPFSGPVIDVMEAKRRIAPMPPSALTPGTPPDLDALCMALLAPQPERRPGGAEVLRLLGAPLPPSVGGAADALTPFVGRRGELGALADELAAARTGARTVLVEGESGVGKSTLMRAFVAALPAEVLVLAGRCYERESVPFKAVDGVIDALSHHLEELGDAEVAALAPPDAARLAQAFPVLARLSRSAGEPVAIRDPHEIRRVVFATLRELLTRLARARPVVIAIDDVQRADADSLALLAEVLRGPVAPSLLLVATVRTGGGRPADELAAGLPGPVRVLPVPRLPRDEARHLALHLLGGGAQQGDLTRIVDESGGHPLFIDALVRHQRDLPGPLLLDEALQARIGRLDAPAQRLLGAIAVAGGPVAQDIAAEVAGIDSAALAPLIGELSSAHLVAARGLRAADLVECYHDRVRESLLRSLAAEVLAGAHRRLAGVLEGRGSGDLEALSVHWAAAGEPARAARYALEAAEHARAALAFDRAARLYQRALDLGLPGGDEVERPVLVELGHALVNADRAVEGARAFRAAAARTSGDAALELRRLAVEQLLHEERIDEGLTLLRGVLADVGLTLPEDRRVSLASYLWHRTRVRLRGLEFQGGQASAASPELLRRADACWTAGTGLVFVDPLRAMDFQARAVLYALESGDPRRIARTLAIYGLSMAALGGRGVARALEVTETVRRIAERTGDDHALALAGLAAGTALHYGGEWRKARPICEDAERMLRTRVRGAGWELRFLQGTVLQILMQLGDFAEVRERIGRLELEAEIAEKRGNQHQAQYLKLPLALVGCMMGKDVGELRAQIAALPSSGFTRRWGVFNVQAQLELYAGDARGAYDRVRAFWPTLRRSYLMHVQHVRIVASSLRARAALALAASTPQGHPDRPALHREADDAADRLAREGRPGAAAMANVMRGVAAAQRGDRPRALALLAAGEATADGHGMALMAHGVRWARGRYLGGDDGQALCASAEAWLLPRGLPDPARLAALLASGLCDTHAR